MICAHDFTNFCIHLLCSCVYVHMYYVLMNLYVTVYPILVNITIKIISGENAYPSRLADGTRTSPSWWLHGIWSSNSKLVIWRGRLVTSLPFLNPLWNGDHSRPGKVNKYLSLQIMQDRKPTMSFDLPMRMPSSVT